MMWGRFPVLRIVFLMTFANYSIRCYRPASGAGNTYQPYAAHTTLQVRATHLQSGTADCCLTATAVVLGFDAE